MANLLKAGDIGRFDNVSTIDGTNDKIPVLKADGSVGKASANQIATGASAVDGPASSTDNAVARFDGATGLLIQNSSVLIDDTNNITGAVNITTTGDITAGGGDIDAGASGTAGSVDIFPTTAAMGKTTFTAADNAGNTTTTVTTAAQAGTRTYTVPDTGAATSSFVMTEGAQTLNGTKTIPEIITTNIDVGASGTAGTLDIFPTTASMGKTEFIATDNSGDTITTIITAAQAAARVYTIPDAGQSTANFVFDTDVSDFHQFIGLEGIIATSAGTWTTTRIAQGNYVLRHSAADDTTIIGIDIDPSIRSAASKGFKLDSIDVIFSNATADLDAHTATLDRIEYADTVAVSVNSITLTGTLGVGQNANPQVDTLTVSSPAFDNTALSKYVLEVTVDAATTSAYDFYGIVLNFTRNDH